jgi:hypothetical protein
LLLFKRDAHHQLNILSAPKRQINKIDFITKEDLDRIRHVGIKNAKKNQVEHPDFLRDETPLPFPKLISHSKTEVSPSSPAPSELTKVDNIKIIKQTTTHEILKQDMLKNLNFNRGNLAAHKISNFEIRYERPEGVSEDELNSDEKAFYSFYKRSYASYYNKLTATYEELAVNHPRLVKDFENKHLLVGRVDYDQNGNIITIKILKSSESDEVHNFFEESLKKLVLPNPPKIFLKMKKEFSIYYQVQIN